MPARQRVTESRAEHAETLEDTFAAAIRDGHICDREIAMLARLIRQNTTHWSKQTTELAFVAAYLSGGEDALDNPDTRASRLASLAFAAD